MKPPVTMTPEKLQSLLARATWKGYRQACVALVNEAKRLLGERPTRRLRNYYNALRGVASVMVSTAERKLEHHEGRKDESRIIH